MKKAWMPMGLENQTTSSSPLAGSEKGKKKMRTISKSVGLLLLVNLPLWAEENQIKAVGVLTAKNNPGNVLSLLGQYGLQPLILESSFAVGDSIINDFFLNLQEGENVEARYADARERYLNDMLAFDGSSTLFQQELEEEQQAIRATLFAGNFRTISSDKGDIPRIRRIFRPAHE